MMNHNHLTSELCPVLYNTKEAGGTESEPKVFNGVEFLATNQCSSKCDVVASRRAEGGRSVFEELVDRRQSSCACSRSEMQSVDTREMCRRDQYTGNVLCTTQPFVLMELNDVI